MLGLENLIKDERFKTNLERVKNRIQLDKLIGDLGTKNIPAVGAALNSDIL